MNNSTNGFDLRRLVTDAVELRSVESLKSSHPIGFGVASNHAFNPGFGQSKLRIPKTPDSIDRLRGYLAGVEVPSLSTTLRDQALNALLVSPRLVVPLSRPTEEELLRQGLFVNSGELDCVRAIGFAVVVRSPGMRMHGPVLIEPPVAGYGQLVVVTKPGAPQVFLDGYLSLHWTTATSAFVRGLRDLYSVALPSVQARIPSKRVALFVGAELGERMNEETKARIIEDAVVHKLGITILNYSDARKGLIANTLRREPPSVLVTTVDDWRIYEDLLSNYEIGTSHGVVLRLAAADGADLRSELCERFCELTRVSSNLLPLEELTDATAGPELGKSGPWPVVSAPGERRRHPVFGLLLEDTSDGFWYVKDHAEHGGSRFKRYRLENREFIHDADIGSLGEVIDGKHKGDVGRRIRFSETHGVDG